MSIVLGPLFSQPLHAQAWRRDRAAASERDDYRITAGFRSPDLVNGGTHRATDVGDGRTGQPVIAPASVRARGRRHFDSALGVEYDLGDGWTLELWHLSRTLPVAVTAGVSTRGTWRSVRKGQVVGATGNTGGRLADGSPMLHHTHIVLLDGGTPIDAEPYLLAGRPIPTSLQGGPMPNPPGDEFNDIAKSTHRGAINKLAKLGIAATGGTGKFNPKAAVTREEMAAFLVRLYEAK